MNPLISICIPCYNYADYISEAIESVLRQTYQNFEIIIVDDGSVDNSVEIIKGFNDPRIKLYQNEHNIGGYPTQNKAVSLSKGEFVAVLHADDKYAPEFLEKFVEYYNLYPDKKVFVTGVYELHQHNNKLKPRHPYDKGGVISREVALKSLFLRNNIGNNVNVVMHKSVTSTVGKYSETFTLVGDYEYWIRLAKVYDFVYIPHYLTYYRIHDSNLTHENIEPLLEEGLSVFKYHFSYLKYKNPQLYSSLSDLGSNLFVQRVYFMGMRYKSGELMRNQLKFVNNNLPEIKNRVYFPVLHLISWLIDDFNSDNILFKFFTRLAIYPNNNAMRLKSKELIV